MATIVYAYGARTPDQRDEIIAQMRGANGYYNTLIEIERKRREAVAAVLTESIAVAAVERELRDLDAQIVAAVKADRPPLRPLIRDARERLRAAKAEARAGSKAALELVAEQFHNAAREAYGQAQCYWGTRLQVAASVEQASDTPDMPRFKRWTGEALIAVQIQNGMSTSDALKCENTQFRLELLAPKSDSRRAQNKRHAIAWLRIGSNGRAPVWAKVPTLVHRPLPPVARIKWVKLVRRMVADRERWQVQLTLEIPTESKPVTASACGIDIGWRKVQDGVRVAQLVGDDGHNREFVIPRSVFDRLDHAESIRSIRDRGFDAAKAAALDYFRSASVPETLAERAKTLVQWERHGRLVGLWRSWERHTGDEAVYSLLERWYHQSRHLWQWEAFERRGALNARGKLFEAWAVEVTRRYGRVVLEDMDLSDLARVKPVTAKSMPAPVRSQRFASAAGEFRSRLVTTCKRESVVVVLVDPANTTADCNQCGARNVWDRVVLDHTCTTCGASWDQDVNAGENILARGAVVSEPAEALESAPAMSERQRRMRDAKARKACGSSSRTARKRFGKLALSLWFFDRPATTPSRRLTWRDHSQPPADYGRGAASRDHDRRGRRILPTQNVHVFPEP